MRTFDVIRQDIARFGNIWRDWARYQDSTKCAKLPKFDTTWRSLQRLSDLRQYPNRFDARFARIWKYLARFGKIYQDFHRFDMAWRNLTRFAEISKDMARFRNVRHYLARFRNILGTLTRFGKSLQYSARFGNISRDFGTYRTTRKD